MICLAFYEPPKKQREENTETQFVCESQPWNKQSHEQKSGVCEK